MKAANPNIVVIPANPEKVKGTSAVTHQLRVAAYCRVSTDDEEQLTSYEAQKDYYTKKIMTNKDWTMAGIFADEGITGTSARKRPEFLRMIKHCRQKKIDIILTKSISRFSRNTVDCLNYIRILRDLGIAVIFEKENINTLETESEMFITLYGAFAQAESESISANVRWGKRQAMKDGKAIIQYKKLYAYEKGEDGEPRIIQEEAEVVRQIYNEYLAGSSLRMIVDHLIEQKVPSPCEDGEWSTSKIRSILKNEKYCGDVLLQKTFVSDCITKKTIRNDGQLPKYLVENHHEGIVSKQTFDAVQTEIARRNAEKSHSQKNAPTGIASYTSKYALSDRLICGECGSLYQRRVWSKHGKKRVVWRCISRVDYGTKFCHSSPTIDEEPLQQAILRAINTAMGNRSRLLRELANAMSSELTPYSTDSMTLGEIETMLAELSDETGRIVAMAAEENDAAAYTDRLKAILDETARLKEQREQMLQECDETALLQSRLDSAVTLLQASQQKIDEWDESIIRQLVESVTILSADKILVKLGGGIQIEQEILDQN